MSVVAAPLKKKFTAGNPIKTTYSNRRNQDPKTHQTTKFSIEFASFEEFTPSGGTEATEIAKDPDVAECGVAEVATFELRIGVRALALDVRRDMRVEGGA